MFKRSSIHKSGAAGRISTARKAIFRGLVLSSLLSIPGSAWAQHCDVHDGLSCDSQGKCSCKARPHMTSLQDLIINKLSNAAVRFENKHGLGQRKASCGCDRGSCEPSCGVAEPSCGVAEPTCGIAEPSCGIAEPSCGVAMPTYRVVRPRVRLPEPTCGVAEPTCGVPEPTCGIAEPTCAAPSGPIFGSSGTKTYSYPKASVAPQVRAYVHSNAPNVGKFSDTNRPLPPITSAVPTPPIDNSTEVRDSAPSVPPHPVSVPNKPSSVPTLEAPKIQRIPQNEPLENSLPILKQTPIQQSPIQQPTTLQPTSPSNSRRNPVNPQVPKADNSKPAIESLPDILVDPFRDDAAANTPTSDPSSVELTSGNVRRFRRSEVPVNELRDPSVVPRKMPKEQGDESSSADAESSSVVRTSYLSKKLKSAESNSRSSDVSEETDAPKVARRSVPKRK